MSQKSWKNKNRSEKQQPYWERKQESFANVDTGLMIQCAICKIKCFHNRFSKGQLDRYKEDLARQRRGGRVADLPRCRNCTPQAVAELYCTGCRMTKSLDCFSKRQRQNPDHAKCIPCVQEVEDRLAHLPAAVEEERMQDEARRGNGSSVISGGTASMAASRIQSQTLSTSVNGIYLPDERGSTWGGESVRSPSPSNTEFSVSHTTSTYSGAGTKNSWTKQGAYKPSIQARVQTQMQREDRLKEEAQMAGNRDESDDEADSDWEL